jgi:HEAT repeats
VDLLHYHTPSQVSDPQRLVDLFQLFKAMLDHVAVPKGEDEVERHLRRLRSPGGIITGRLTLWEGGPPRHDAIDELARLRDPSAIDALLEVITDPDPILQSKAVYALGQIGDPKTVPHLVRLLGRRQGQLKRKLADDAADALDALGHGDLVDAFEAALEGDATALAQAPKEFRREVIDALVWALEGPGRLVVAHTVQALAKLGAMEALPELRSRLNNYMLASVREAYEEAIMALEARTNLPRPAVPSSHSMDTLPLPVDPRDQESGQGKAPPSSEELDSPA